MAYHVGARPRTQGGGALRLQDSQASSVERAMPRLLRPIALGCLGLVVGTTTAAANPPPDAPAYPLDGITREVPKSGPLHCPDVALVDYRGEIVRWNVPGKVFGGMRERLRAFESIARDVGVEIYGRPPARIVQLGTYNCRRMRDYPDWISEHALGNAVDVAGFDFGGLPKSATLPSGLDRSFSGAFQVRVGRHWNKRTGHAAVHARFLETLALRTIAHAQKPDGFRVLLGPGYPGHQDHFHFDMAPFRMVQIFVDGEPIERRARD